MPHWTLGHGADWDVIQEIEQGSDRVALIVGVALIDDGLTKALKAFLKRIDKPTLDRWFGVRGVYIDFQKKTDLGMMLGLFGPVTFKDLARLGKARNEAAHETRTKLFQSASIKGICRDLKMPEPPYFDRPHSDLNSKDPKDRFLYTVARITDGLGLLARLPSSHVRLP